MSNQITAKKYQEIKNETRSVFFFASQSSERAESMIGFDLISILEAIELRQRKGLIAVVTSDEIGKKISDFELNCMYGDTKVKGFKRVTYGQVQKIIRESYFV
jgi:hypothetical protein